MTSHQRARGLVNPRYTVDGVEPIAEDTVHVTSIPDHTHTSVPAKKDEDVAVSSEQRHCILDRAHILLCGACFSAFVSVRYANN